MGDAIQTLSCHRRWLLSQVAGDASIVWRAPIRPHVMNLIETLWKNRGPKEVEPILSSRPFEAFPDGKKNGVRERQSFGRLEE